MSYYDRQHLVPKYIFILDIDFTDKMKEKLAERLLNNGYEYRDWPSQGFSQALGNYSRNGYHEYLNQEMPFFLDVNLSIRALHDAFKVFNPYPQFNPHKSTSQVNMRIADESDYERVFNDLLETATDESISQLFCSKDVKKGLYSFIPPGKFPLDRITEKVLMLDQDFKYPQDLIGMKSQQKISNVFEIIEGKEQA